MGANKRCNPKVNRLTYTNKQNIIYDRICVMAAVKGFASFMLLSRRVEYFFLFFSSCWCVLTICLHSVCLYVRGVTVWYDPGCPNESPSWASKGSHYQILNVLLHISEFQRSMAWFCVLCWLKATRQIMISADCIIHTKTIKTRPVKMWYAAINACTHLYHFY